MKQRRTISNLLTSRLLMVIRDEENFAEKATIRFNYARLILVLGTALIILSGISFILVTTVLARWFDPRVEYVNTTRQLLELDTKVDSLSEQNRVKQQFIDNVKNILEGNINPEVEEKAPGYKITDVDLTQINPIDLQFRKEFEEIDYEQLAYRNSTREELIQLFLFTPINGVVSREFDLKSRHYGTDIVSRKNEPVKCVADGTVIMSSWTQESGFVIGVQHKSQLLSFYKHNSVLLKKVGETVKAGDILSIIGNTGEFTDGPHLHFELWYNGVPVNPTDYLSFE